MSSRLRLASATSIVALMASSVVAQTAQPSANGAPASSATPSEAAAPRTTLGEVIVTAQQRGENLQKAAIAVDVVAGAELVTSGVTNIENLTKLVPALTVEGTSNGSLLFIRGVGNFTFAPSSDPASAFNYDGIYIGRPTSNAGAFYDLQRIEVLKGPQGTLYGRNATAGAINVLPVQPKLGQFGAFATASYGNYNAVISEGAVNIPLGERSAVRVSGSYDRHDAYTIGGTGTENSGGTRIQFKSQLTPDITVRVSGDYSHQGGTGPGNSYLGTFALDKPTQQYVFKPNNIPSSQDLFSPTSQTFLQTIRAGGAGRNFVPLVDFPFEDNSFYGVHAQIDWDTPLGVFTVLPAFRESDKHNLSNLSLVVGDTQLAQQYSVEARLVSHPGKVFDYNFGFYYFDERIKDHQSAGVQSIVSFTTSSYKTDSPAGYGRLTWHVTDRLRLTGGFRYTSDDKRFNSTSTTLALVCVSPLGCPTVSLLPYTTTLSQQPNVPAANGGRVLVGPGALVARIDGSSNAQFSASKPTYRGAVEFDLAPRSLLYASVETGYRAGGFNTATGFETFGPENIIAYTAGIKNRLFDNRVQLNIEAFDWEYRDQQLSALGLDLTGRPTVITRNIGKSTIRGVEVEGQFLVAPQTVLSADLQYLDANYDSFIYHPPVSSGIPYTGCPVSVDVGTPTLYDVNCSGKPLFNAPKLTINAGIQHTIPVGSYDVVLTANTQFRTGRYTSFDYVQQEHVGNTTVTDAQVALSPRNGPWSIAAFVHNLENDRIQVYGSPGLASNLFVVTYGDPRTYGVRLSAKF